MAGDLKRLGFIPTYADFLYSKTLDAYGATKTFTPLFLQNQLLKPVEVKVVELAAPIAVSVQTGSLSLLATLDSKVDGTVSTVESLVKTAWGRWSDLQSTGVAKLTDARSCAMKKVLELSEQVQKEGLISSTAKIYSQAVKKQMNIAKQTYFSVHDAVAASPYYHSVYDAGKDVLSRAQASSLYKGLAARVLPVISNVAGYELDAITKSEYYQLALQQLQPIKVIKA